MSRSHCAAALSNASRWAGVTAVRKRTSIRYAALTPVAPRVTGFPVMPLPLAVAVSVFVPSWTVQLPTVATPSTPVVAFAPVTLPPPLATAKVTATLGTGRLAASRTTTAGAMLRAYPLSPVWPSPLALMSWAAVCATDTVTWALNPPVVATACALPLPTAVTKPDADTVATLPLSEDQLTLAFFIVSARWSSTTATTCRVAPIELKLSVLGSTWRLVGTGTNGSVPLQAARAMVTNVIGAQRRRVTGIGVTIPAPVHGATLGKCSRTSILDRGDSLA